MQIYTSNPALEAAFAIPTAIEQSSPVKPDLGKESSIAHFCAFVDFYTRQCNDPLSTSLACEKQAEALRITSEDLTPATMRQVIDTMLVVIEHLEQKWLDEQIQHEDRKRRHREDVARLHQQLNAVQQQSARQSHLLRRGVQWLHQHFVWKKGLPMNAIPRKKSLKPKVLVAC